MGHTTNSTEQLKLAAVLEDAWCRESSASPEQWSEHNPALGQCAVTACVVQDQLGGEILNSIATLPDGTTESHYVNSIDGEIVDYTRGQFPEDTELSEPTPKPGTFDTTRDYVLSYEATRERYAVLAARVLQLMEQLQ